MKPNNNRSIDENDHEMESDDNDGRLNHDIGLGSFDEHHDEVAEMMD